MTKVLAINGSARMEKGHTHRILTSFLEGMEEADATVEAIFAKRFKIRPCLGDFDCWYEKVGKCIQNDDMEKLYPKFRDADILVLAIPIYFPIPGEMQNLLNRLMPLIEPILEFRDGRTRAKFHDDVKISKIVLVSTGGWWEKENMELLVNFVDHMAKDASVEFSGAVLRPHASLMNKYKETAEEILSAVKDAGTQLVRTGKMSEETLETISKPLQSEKELRDYYNKEYL
ncbi:MAG: flavodoxin family protein, partial [Candidatus Thorarchaeota archaeon]